MTTEEAVPFVDIVKDGVRVVRATRFVSTSDLDPVDRRRRTMVGFWSSVSLRVGENYRVVLETGEELPIRIWMSPAGASSAYPVRITAQVLS